MKTAVLDIGGSFIKYGQMDEELAITERGKVRTPEADRDAPPEEGRAAFLDVLDGVWEKIGNGVDGLAISMPGVIDSAKIGRASCRERVFITV